jgi:hypothetical protein
VVAVLRGFFLEELGLVEWLEREKRGARCDQWLGGLPRGTVALADLQGLMAAQGYKLLAKELKPLIRRVFKLEREIEYDQAPAFKFSLFLERAIKKDSREDSDSRQDSWWEREKQQIASFFEARKRRG